MESKAGQKQEFFVGSHAVCVIDLLAQKSKLAEWRQIPSEPQPTPEFIRSIRQTAGTILKFQEMFEDFFQKVAATYFPALLDSLPREGREIYRRCKECRLNTQQFSDTFVFYSLIPNAYGDVSMVPLYRILTACCMAMTCSLAASIPIRGSVCVGMGVELAEHNFYGPALAEAHHLEDEIAQYPRIVVSPDAVRFLQGNLGFSEHPSIESLMKSLAGTCRSILCHDEDHNIIVDFLGRGIFDILGPEPTHVDAVEKAYRFVLSESDRFKQIGDEKLAPRYESLRRYMETRLSIWGLGHLGDCVS